MNTDKIIRDRIQELGLPYDREFKVGDDVYMITTYNEVLKRAYDKRGWPVWIKAGRVEKFLWSKEFEELESEK